MKVRSIALTFGFFLAAGLPLGATADPPPGDTSAAVALSADANGDGCVDARDYIIMAKEWGNTPPAPITSDANGDTVVSQADQAIMTSEWGQCL